MNKEEQKGYNDAIAALKKMLSGQQSSGSGKLQMPSGGSNSGTGSGSSGSGKNNKKGNISKMNTPQLNADDQKKAEKNAKNGSGKSQASDESRKQAANACGVSTGVSPSELNILYFI